MGHDGAQQSGLSAPFEPLLHSPELREAWRACFDAVPLSCAVGLPALHGPDALGGWLRASDVLIELSRAPSEQSFACGVLLQAASATRAVDRMLGSTLETGAASGRTGPSEAECGLLAYAAARLLAAWGAGWIVRDVRLDPTPLVAAGEPLVHWPFALTTTFGRLDAALLLSPSTMCSFTQRATVSALLSDTYETDVLQALALGDLIVSDAWWMTDTAEGLTGDVLVAAHGTDSHLRARLGRGMLEVYERVEAPRPGRLSLLLAERDLSLIDLARLAGGAPVAFAIEGARATLVHGATILGAGELVLHRGRLGVRLSELRRPGAP